MDSSGLERVQRALDKTLGESAVEVRLDVTGEYASLCPTGATFRNAGDEIRAPFVPRPDEMLGALGCAGLTDSTAPTASTRHARTESQTPRLKFLDVYNAADSPYPQVLVQDLNHSQSRRRE